MNFAVVVVGAAFPVAVVVVVAAAVIAVVVAPAVVVEVSKSSTQGEAVAYEVVAVVAKTSYQNLLSELPCS